MNKISQIKAIRGMTDILPAESPLWAEIEDSARRLFSSYGYKEIRTPIVEETALFKRSIGQSTDIVQKEMYSFTDRGGRNLTLRPEATACVVRAFLQHHMHKKNPINKLFYIGPMFRSERPQAGRQRQFHQIGVEALGSDSPYLDAEVIALLDNFLKARGLSGFKIRLNSLGCGEDKKKFGKKLKGQLASKANALCKDCKARVEKNVFRVLDCKNESCRSIIRALPVIENALCEECKGHFDKVTGTLDDLGVKYTKDAFLVRGLDYYTRTVFEAVHQSLGAQDAIAAGGRYDNLVEDLGGPSVPATGFAIGIERLIQAMPAKKKEARAAGKKIFIAALGEAASREGIKLADKLRRKGVSSELDYLGRSLKAQLRLASKEGFSHTAIIGEDELKKGEIIIKDMNKGQQKTVKLEKFKDEIASALRASQ